MEENGDPEEGEEGEAETTDLNCLSTQSSLNIGLCAPHYGDWESRPGFYFIYDIDIV